MQNRVIIENVQPEVDGGRYFIKRIVGEKVTVTADIFADGHDVLRAVLKYRREGQKKWESVLMESLPNDVWEAGFTPDSQGMYEYTVEAWIDHLATWYKGFRKKYDDAQYMGVEIEIGAALLRKNLKNYSKAKQAPLQQYIRLMEANEDYEAVVETILGDEFAFVVYAYPLIQYPTAYDRVLRVRVERKKALFSSWYELFPRSASSIPGQHGTFKDCERLLPRIAEMGFDVLYLPPIHPIGKLNRKGKNNSVTAEAGEPGSPWAIGSDEGGHKAIHAELGTLEDYKALIRAARQYDIDIAFDLAFQCAPDHPYIKEHPEWFVWRPDGTIAYAENPPKKYQDIVPINFETEAWESLWQELKSVILYWVEQGVTIFRVDNPHTKAFRFWEWVIAETHKVNQDVIFLSEAFTRPKVTASLAKAGYTQAYTYFTWRNSKAEMEQYLTELTKTPLREYFRPNFWPNTPDILPYGLQGADSNAFVQRLSMAATLSSNYGLYGPAYEFCDNRPVYGKEEYLDSEKYEIKHHDWSERNRLTHMMTRLNQIRRENSAFHTTFNLHFTKTTSDQLMSYIKVSDDRSNIIWCVVSFDTRHVHGGYVEKPYALFGNNHVIVRDLLTNERYYWNSEWNYVELNPYRYPLHIFRIEPY